jgi:hypothetical protein
LRCFFTALFSIVLEEKLAFIVHAYEAKQQIKASHKKVRGSNIYLNIQDWASRWGPFDYFASGCAWRRAWPHSQKSKFEAARKDESFVLM